MFIFKVNNGQQQQLEFDVATLNHEKIPFKVKQNLDHTLLSFGNDKVIDFNLALRKLIESSSSDSSITDERLKAQLESKSSLFSNY